MPPLPKPPELRQRRNKTATAAKLATTQGQVTKPELPKRRRRWHALTVAWWDDVWQSPMAAEFLQADIHGLYMLADLIDHYWREGGTTLAAEIRMQGQRFGLSPIDRRRLQWEVHRIEETIKRKAPPRQQPKRSADPRDVLRIVS